MTQKEKDAEQSAPPPGKQPKILGSKDDIFGTEAGQARRQVDFGIFNQFLRLYLQQKPHPVHCFFVLFFLNLFSGLLMRHCFVCAGRQRKGTPYIMKTSLVWGRKEEIQINARLTVIAASSLLAQT